MELKVNVDVHYGDAIEFSDIDEYNVFYFYNPFSADVLVPVCHNIEDSFSRNHRKIYLIYANPFHHMDIVKQTRFRLYKQFESIAYDPIVNIYSLQEK